MEDKNMIERMYDYERFEIWIEEQQKPFECELVISITGLNMDISWVDEENDDSYLLSVQLEDIYIEQEEDGYLRLNLYDSKYKLYCYS